MVWYLLNVYVHVVATVFWIGYALFWTIMAGSLAQRFDRPESHRFLRLIGQAAWPPAGIPTPYRLSFPDLGWVALGCLMLTGGFLLPYRGITLERMLTGEVSLDSFLVGKLLLVATVLICQVRLSVRPSPRVIRLHMGTALCVVVLSVLLVHAP